MGIRRYTFGRLDHVLFLHLERSKMDRKGKNHVVLILWQVFDTWIKTYE